MYKVVRNSNYDFLGESYATNYPNIHKYPATMLPQIGINLLKELNINQGTMLDPYCGSGSSFAAGLEIGLKTMEGFDLNPLAVLISSVKFRKININTLNKYKDIVETQIDESLKDAIYLSSINHPNIKNLNFWFSDEVLLKLALIKRVIEDIKDESVRQFFWVPLSETIRECSYTRNSEFKLYKMNQESLLKFNPDVVSTYIGKLTKNIFIYEKFYYPKLNSTKVKITNTAFNATNANSNKYDVVLTSPPYGDSKTTVAYGQFSTFSNEWLGIEEARAIDGKAMGGKKSKQLFLEGVMEESIEKIYNQSTARALEVSSFYYDLADSIKNVSKSIKSGGKSIYVVGNRSVKGLRLPTDQFIAEQFEANGFTHLTTYERLLSSKSMPLKNSPTNEVGKVVDTMNFEYIVICEKN